MIEKLKEQATLEMGDFSVGSIREFSLEQYTKLLIQELTSIIESDKFRGDELTLTDWEQGRNCGLERAKELIGNILK